MNEKKTLKKQKFLNKLFIIISNTLMHLLFLEKKLNINKNALYIYDISI